MDSPVIVCYMGGTCGDLVTALIDSQDFNGRHCPQRQRLKKPHLFADYKEMDQYLQHMSEKYRSVPSHSMQYHIDRKHRFLGIDVQDWSTAIWAATRFRDLHEPHVWKEMNRWCGADSVEAYAQNLIDFGSLVRQHAQHVISLESIRSGCAIDKLSSIIELDSSAKDLYDKWLLNNEAMHNTNS